MRGLRGTQRRVAQLHGLLRYSHWDVLFAGACFKDFVLQTKASERELGQKGLNVPVSNSRLAEPPDSGSGQLHGKPASVHADIRREAPAALATA